jgi:hypothetical protein
MLFFSYSRGNLLVVRAVAGELRRLGYRTWLDLESLRPGERWREAIARAMAASDAMVYCISRLSLESAWTSVELQAARECGLPVVPLLVDDSPIDQLPPALRELHLVSTAEWPTHELPLRAAHAIARAVGRPSVPEGSVFDGAAPTLRVEVDAAADGEVMLGWVSATWRSPAAPLVADALCALGRAADEARSADLHVGQRVDPAAAALVLGTLAARLGPARVRVLAHAAMSPALADAARRVQAVVTAPTMPTDLTECLTAQRTGGRVK